MNDKDNGVERVLTLAEAAAFLRISRATMYRLAEDGRFPAFRLGGGWRVHPALLKKWIEKHTPIAR